MRKFSGLIIFIFYILFIGIMPLLAANYNNIRKSNQKIRPWRDKVDKFWVGYIKFLTRFSILALTIIIAVIYIVYIYPLIPQSLGGARPRPAVLEIYKDKLTTETYLNLGVKYDTNTNVLKTGKVLVFYETKENLLVAPPDTSSKKERVIYDIKKDAISSIRWLLK